MSKREEEREEEREEQILEATQWVDDAETQLRIARSHFNADNPAEARGHIELAITSLRDAVRSAYRAEAL